MNIMSMGLKHPQNILFYFRVSMRAEVRQYFNRQHLIVGGRVNNKMPPIIQEDNTVVRRYKGGVLKKVIFLDAVKQGFYIPHPFFYPVHLYYDVFR